MADLPVRFFQALDVALGGLFVEDRVVLRLHFELELIMAQLVAALEGDVVDDEVALGDGDDDLVVYDLRRNLFEHARRRKVGDGAVHTRLVGSRKIAANGVGVAARGALDDDFVGKGPGRRLRDRRALRQKDSQRQGQRKNEPFKAVVKQLHLARLPRIADPAAAAVAPLAARREERL